MIVMNDFIKEYQENKSTIDRAIHDVLLSGRLILGKKVEEFEKKFALYIGTKYCIGVANGLEALQISLMALGIGKGDEVITVSNSAVATALAISNVGAKAVFVDVDEYYHLDPAELESAITPKTKAIIPVHLFGQVANINAILEIAKKNKLTVVEDAAQAHGAMYEEKKVGSFGTFGCFSFYPTKNLGAYGDGGAITTDSKEFYEICKMLRNYGQTDRYKHVLKGLNSRLDELQAAILTEKLKNLDTMNKRRRRIASLYMEQLKGVHEITLPSIRPNTVHVFHLFVIQADRRNELITYLKTKDIQSLIHYPIPIHKQECYRKYNNVSLPRTETLTHAILSLPIHPFLSDEDVMYVCKSIKEFYDR